MTASFVTISDMHLGYDRSVLNSLSAQETLVSVIAGASGGTIDRLILNGDCFEVCVPKDADLWRSHMYVSPFTGMVSRAFFAELTRRVIVKQLVIIPGNHDYALWSKIRWKIPGSDPVGLRDPFGNEAAAATGALDAVIGPSKKCFSRISLAYPAFFLGGQWPYCVFHHGHFLDDLVLGQGSAEEYHALAALGTGGRPNVVLDVHETLSSLSTKTDPFIKALWAPNSKARSLLWAMFRRDEKVMHCFGAPGLERLSTLTTKNLKWFLELLVVDSRAPFPGVKNREWPSYLFVGHDHVGGSWPGVVEGPDGCNFKVINTGGWTRDGREGTYPHGHVVVWDQGASEPKVVAVAL